jgi:hypothetical protein
VTTEKLFDPNEIFQQLQDASLDPSVFETIDERGVDKAPNILEWAINPSFLNTKILPRQLAVAAKLLADYCPRCSNPGYIDRVFSESMGQIRDNIMFLEHGVCPKCRTNRYELISSRDLIEYTELVGCIGQRAGKSKLVTLLATYILHRILKLPNPLRHYDQPTGELLTGTFSALIADQAQRNLWEPFKGYIDQSPWFQSYHKFLKLEGKRLGVELWIDRRSFLAYPHKNMIWHFTGSVDETMRGATRIFVAIDELGWFHSENKDDRIKNADAVYTALGNSLSTMRRKYQMVWSQDSFDSPPIIMANVSSPSSAKDKIMRLLKDANQNPKILPVHCATWEFNPDWTEQILREEFSAMPENNFMRDFGAEPPLASDPYISDPRYIDKMAITQGEPLLHTELLRSEDDFGYASRSIKAVIDKVEKNVPRMLTFDLGHTKNGLAVCMFSLGPDSKIRLDFAANLRPEPKAPININQVYEQLTIPILSNYNIKHVFFDRWNSLDQVQRLRDLKKDARIYSLTYKDLSMVKGTVVSQGVVMPKMPRAMEDSVKSYLENDDKLDKEPFCLLGIQLLTVRDLGMRVAKPLQGDDDLFRAFALGVNRMSDPVIRKEYSSGAKALDSGHVVRALGTVRHATRLLGTTGSGGGSAPMSPRAPGNTSKTVGLVYNLRKGRP